MQSLRMWVWSQKQHYAEDYADERQNDFFLAGSEDGTVCMYSLDTYTYEKMLTRCTLPVRDIALSPDGQWAAVASE